MFRYFYLQAFHSVWCDAHLQIPGNYLIYPADAVHQKGGAFSHPFILKFLRYSCGGSFAAPFFLLFQGLAPKSAKRGFFFP
jgi:hypothetical protein